MRITLDVNLTKRMITIIDQTDFKRGCGVLYNGEISIQSCCEPQICMGIFYTRGTFRSKDFKETFYDSDARLAAIVRSLAKCCEYISIRFATT